MRRHARSWRPPSEIATTTSPWGLSRHEASRRLINEIETELKHAELAESKAVEEPENSRLRCCPKLTNKLPGFLQYYFGTEDGFLGTVACLLMLMLALMPPVQFTGMSEAIRFRDCLGYFLLCLPYFLGNGWSYYVLRRVERIRAASQLKEALAQYKASIRREYVAKGKHHRPAYTDASVSEVAIPSSSLASVLRDGEWTRLPFNLIVCGDTLKLCRGDIAPCHAIRVVLSSTFRKEQMIDSIPDAYELVFDNASIAKGDMMEDDMGIFVSTETPAVGQVKRFMESAAQARMRRSAAFSDNLAAPFISNAENVYAFVLCPAMWVIIAVCTLIVSIRWFVFPNTIIAKEPVSLVRDTLMVPLLVLILYNPMLVRLIGQMGDIWANARLQSLFLFHHERRFLEEHGGQCEECDAANEADESDSCDTVPSHSTPSNSSVLSGPSSVHSDVSISRVPFRKQLEELVSVYRQGLDGSTNLLHALASTTYLCFVDHEALVTDQGGQLKEICVLDGKQLGAELTNQGTARSRSDLDRTASLEPWKLHTLQVTSTAFDEGFYDNEKVRNKTLEEPDMSPQSEWTNKDRKRRFVSNRRRRKWQKAAFTSHALGVNEENAFRASDEWQSPSQDSVDEPSQDSLVISPRDRGRRENVNRSISENIDLARSENEGTYIRFVHETLGKRLEPNLLPLALGLQMTQAPPIPRMLGASVGWLHTQRLHDVFQREEWNWNCCLCGAADLLDTRLAGFSPVRHILLISGEMPLSLTRMSMSTMPPLINKDTLHMEEETLETATMDAAVAPNADLELTLPDVPNYQRSYLEKKPLLYSVVARDSRDDTMHLFVRGSAEALMGKCKLVFDGSGLRTVSEQILQKLETLLTQWKSEGLVVHCLAYGQIPESSRDFLLQSLEEYTLLSAGSPGSRLDTSLPDTETAWEPLIAYPGPRSVLRRPEPFVFPSTLKSIDGEGRCASDEQHQWPTLNFLNYNNNIVRTPYPAFTERQLGDDDSRRKASFIEEQHLGLYHKVSWLPHKCQVRGASVLKTLIDHNLILTGLVGLKQTTPPGVPRRITDFHSAGVRFSLFSPYDIRSTRTLGEVLGLETGWNCLISLEDHDREEGFVNQDGNEVLPSGISRIRRHVKHVDNIPLLVSLYANSTPKTVLHFLKLLQSQNEVVTVVGSALKTSNFDVFKIASCPISILPLPYTLCPKCHGRKSVGPSYSPTLLPEYSFSAALTSLPCALQSHAVSYRNHLPQHLNKAATAAPGDSPEFLLQLLYSIFQEARRLMSGVQSAMTLSILVNAILLGGFLLFQLMSNFPCVLSIDDVFIFSSLYVPLLSVAMFSNPARPGLMTTLPSNILPENRPLAVKRDDSMESADLPSLAKGSRQNQIAKPTAQARKSVLLQILKILFPLVSIVIILNLYFVGFLRNLVRSDRFTEPINVSIFGPWWQVLAALDKTLEDKHLSMYVLRIYNQLGVVVTLTHLFVLAFCHTSRYDGCWTTAVLPLRNKALLLAVCVILCGAALRATVQLVPIRGDARGWLWQKAVPASHWWWILVACSPCLTLLICETIKHIDKQQHERRQKFLRLFFHTRLGMWSPK